MTSRVSIFALMRQLKQPPATHSTRPRPDLIVWIFLGANILIAIVGQMFSKFGAEIIQAGHSLLNGPVIIGYFLLVIRGFLWIMALRTLPLSVAYPFNGLTFVGVFILSFALFGEPLTAPGIIGMTSIVIGILLLGENHAKQ